MFESDYQTSNDTEVPAIFCAIAELTGASPINVCDAVIASLAAIPTLHGDEFVAMYRQLLRGIVDGYATANGIAHDRVADALVSAAEASDRMKKKIEDERAARKQAERLGQ